MVAVGGTRKEEGAWEHGERGRRQFKREKSTRTGTRYKAGQCRRNHGTSAVPYRKYLEEDTEVYTELAEGLAGEEVDAFSSDASLVKRRRVGHSGFSSQNVGVPREGELYAGSSASHAPRT